MYEIFLFEHGYMKFWIMLIVHIHLNQSYRNEFFCLNVAALSVGGRGGGRLTAVSV